MINNELSIEPKKKFNYKYTLYFIIMELIATFVVSFVAGLTGYSEEGPNNPTYLYTILLVINKIAPLLFIVLIYHKRFSEAGKDTFKNFSKFLIYTSIAFVVFFMANYGLTFYEYAFVKEDSANQQTIISLFTVSDSNINIALLFLTLVILAPLLEEIEYRELLFKTFEGCHFIVPTLISATLFALAHTLPAILEQFPIGMTSLSDESIEIIKSEIINIPVYFIPGFVLALIYHYSNNNFYSTFLIHAVWNYISFTEIMNMVGQA